jgi:magnesium transporter
METLAAIRNVPIDTVQRPLLAQLKAAQPAEAAALIADEPIATAAQALVALSPAQAIDILHALPEPLLEAVTLNVPAAVVQQWQRNRRYAPDQVGRFMEPARGTMAPDTTVAAAIAELRRAVQHASITYLYVVDSSQRLVGVVTTRDLLVSSPDVRLGDVMLRDVYSLLPQTSVADAMKAMVGRHYPVYPVCDEGGVLVGLVRGQTLFDARTVEITAQPGSMVGVEKEERVATPWQRSLRFRHPWLQLNHATAFAAGGIVALFQDTVDRLVILALFLPVLAGQSGNTGCQALAVTLRGITLGDLRPGGARLLVLKEAALGLMNGAATGLVAALGMYAVAMTQHNPHALVLALVVWLALVGSCIASGICGALVPLTLKRFGADPATASSIFLTTATDVVSMGMLLGLATWLIH